MSADDLNDRIEALQRALERHWGGANGPAEPEPILAEAFDQIQTTLEELRVADEELRQQNEELAAVHLAAEAQGRRYQDLFNFAPDGYLLTDPGGHIQEANRAALALLRAEESSVVGKPLIVFLAEEECPGFRALLGRLREGEEVRGEEVRLRPRHGAPVPVSLNVAAAFEPGGRLVGLRWLLHDVTERRRAERLLAGQGRILEMIATGAPLPEVLRELSRTVEEQSPGILCSILLLDGAGARLRCGAAPSFPEGYNASIDGLEVGPESGACGTAAYWGRRTIITDIANDPKWSAFRELALAHRLRSCWSDPIRSRAGQVLGTFAIYGPEPGGPSAHHLRLLDTASHLAAIAIERQREEEALRRAHDELELRVADRTAELAQANEALRGEIRERRRAEEALRRERDFAESLIEAAQAIVLVLDLEGRIVRFNSYMEEVSGYSLEEIRGRDFFGLFVPRPQWSHLRGAFLKAVAHLHVRGYQHPIVSRAGTELEIEWYIKTLEDGHGVPVGVLAIGTDITPLKEAQERALQAERLAAIGQMITGLAHESRNALQRSQACLEMLARRVQDRAEAAELIGRLQNAQHHLQHLYEEVRGYAAPLQLSLQRCDLGAVLQEAWEHLALQRAGRETRLRQEAGALDLHGEVDRHSMEQVFRNILENSLSACPGPAEVEARWCECQLDGRPVLQVALRDNGPGLTAQARERIFEPFYTTKTRGTGLGMAIVKRIVEAHGGKVWVGPGPGAEIVIALPKGIS